MFSSKSAFSPTSATKHPCATGQRAAVAARVCVTPGRGSWTGFVNVVPSLLSSGVPPGDQIGGAGNVDLRQSSCAKRKRPRRGEPFAVCSPGRISPDGLPTSYSPVHQLTNREVVRGRPGGLVAEVDVVGMLPTTSQPRSAAARNTAGFTPRSRSWSLSATRSLSLTSQHQPRIRKLGPAAPRRRTNCAT